MSRKYRQQGYQDSDRDDDRRRERSAPRREMTREHWLRLASTIRSEAEERYSLPGQIDVIAKVASIQIRCSRQTALASRTPSTRVSAFVICISEIEDACDNDVRSSLVSDCSGTPAAATPGPLERRC